MEVDKETLAFRCPSCIEWKEPLCVCAADRIHSRQFNDLLCGYGSMHECEIISRAVTKVTSLQSTAHRPRAPSVDSRWQIKKKKERTTTLQGMICDDTDNSGEIVVKVYGLRIVEVWWNNSHLVLAFLLWSMCPLYTSPQFANPQNVPSCCSSLPYCFLDHPSSEVSVAEAKPGPLSPFSESSIVPQSRVSQDCYPFSSNPWSRSGSPSLVILRHHPHNRKSHIRTQTSSLVTNS